MSHQTVGNMLLRHGSSVAKRKQAISWKDFIRSHMEVLERTDFFTVEVLTLRGYLLCPVFHSLGESAGELGSNDVLPGPGVDGTASPKVLRARGRVGIQAGTACHV